MSQFQTGDRVLYRSRQVGKGAFHCASLGYWGTVMHLNRRDEQGRVIPITGTIVKQNPGDMDGREYYIFQPDGWPVDARNQGFEAPADWLEPLTEPDLHLPGILTDERGTPK